MRVILFSALTLASLTYPQLALAQTPSEQLHKGAIAQIQGDIAKQMGHGDITAKCDAPPATPKVGDSFKCTGTTQDNQSVIVMVSIGDGGNVSVNATNVMQHAGVQKIIETGLPEFNRKSGLTLSVSDIDCGLTAILDPATNQFPCIIHVPKSNEQRKASVKILDIAAGEFEVNVH